jgi:hypothetical protein
MSCAYVNPNNNQACRFKGFIHCEKNDALYCKRHAPFKYRDNIDNINACPICFDPCKNNRHTIDLLKCNHGFHRKCLNDWIANGGTTCPVCRDALSMVADSHSSPETMTREQAYQALELFFMEGYSIPQHVYEQAMDTFDWAVYFDVWDDRSQPRIVF